MISLALNGVILVWSAGLGPGAEQNDHNNTQLVYDTIPLYMSWHCILQLSVAQQ